MKTKTRICQESGCNTILSRYNTAPYCRAHQQLRSKIDTGVDEASLHCSKSWSLVRAMQALKESNPNGF